MIERGEVVALLFNVSDILRTLERIESLSKTTMSEKKRKPENEAERSQRRDSAARLHELAEEALAKLPPHFAEARERAGSNAAWLRQLAEKAQAKLDPPKQPEA